MNMNQLAHTAEDNISLKNEREVSLPNRILNERKSNSSVVSAGLSIGVSPKVIEMFLPAMLEATKTLNEQNKIKGN